MAKTEFEPHLISDSMVIEANLDDFSLGKILSDSVLRGYLDIALRISPPGSLIWEHFCWIKSEFPELSQADEIPHPWVWKDLVIDAPNVGSISESANKFQHWKTDGYQVAYWTGGVEFNFSQSKVAKWVVEQGYNLIIGVEPWCYPDEFQKGRSAITETSVPISFWSKFLEKAGFGKKSYIFEVPRPLPESSQAVNSFYDDLYKEITNGEGLIVLSENDPYYEEKLKRGPVIEVPIFAGPSTTDLWNSAVLPRSI